MPELDVVVVVFEGNYNDWEMGFRFLLETVPEDILPAVDVSGM